MYKLNMFSWQKEPSSVLRLEDSGAVYCIPFDPANTDYQQYLKWLEEGNTPLPADPQPE